MFFGRKGEPNDGNFRGKVFRCSMVSAEDNVPSLTFSAFLVMGGSRRAIQPIPLGFRKESRLYDEALGTWVGETTAWRARMAAPLQFLHERDCVVRAWNRRFRAST